jgi:hypothetical protein
LNGTSGRQHLLDVELRAGDERAAATEVFGVERRLREHHRVAAVLRQEEALIARGHAALALQLLLAQAREERAGLGLVLGALFVGVDAEVEGGPSTSPSSGSCAWTG